MVTLESPRKRSGRVCGPITTSWTSSGNLDASETSHVIRLVITGSFNGLLHRLANVDYFDVWLTGKKVLKKAKKQGVKAVIRISEVLTLTGLTTDDMKIFCLSLGFIKIVENGEDPVLLASDVFGLLKIFQRFVDQGMICKSTRE